MNLLYWLYDYIFEPPTYKKIMVDGKEITIKFANKRKVMRSARRIMKKHAAVFRKLAELEQNEKK